LPLTLLAAAAVVALAGAAAPPDDPYLWLEEVSGERALAWVREQNLRAEKTAAAEPRYEQLRADFRRILDSAAKIPYVTRMGGHYYNFWRDARQVRGVWRRTRVEEYAKHAPEWETVLDLDALAEAEGENWVWKTPVCLQPDQSGAPYVRCMLRLSRGGADATVVREFDLRTRSFVANGFALAEAKSDVDWADLDHLWVATDFGPGSLTQSGYARVAKLWKRGTPLAEARTVFSGRTDDIAVAAFTTHGLGRKRSWIYRGLGVREQEYFALIDGAARHLEIPRDATLEFFHDWMLVHTRRDWAPAGRRFRAGSLLAIASDRFLRGRRDFAVLYAPGERSALQAVATMRTAVLFTELDNVRSRLHEAVFDGKAWRTRRVPTPDNVRLGVAASYWDADDYLLSVEGFTRPTTLYAGTVGLSDWKDFRAVKSLPEFFDAAGLTSEQREAVSRDGTRIPYFIVRRVSAGGPSPTLLTGYGGFELAQLPSYSAILGRGWLEAGGALVRANIRGGGEFGPQWHRVAQREGRQKTFDDFIAVAEDLVRTGMTRPSRLGIFGGSQGGLLVTGSMVQRPDLFGAVVAQVPLTDMLRYHKLLAGASWMSEYGNPDLPADRAFIARYSPYQNLQADAHYPPILLATSTRDDRVHPGHARKFAARLAEQGHEFLYFENVEGGHSAGANNAQAAQVWALTLAFFARRLGLETSAR